MQMKLCEGIYDVFFRAQGCRNHDVLEGPTTAVSLVQVDDHLRRIHQDPLTLNTMSLHC